MTPNGVIFLFFPFFSFLWVSSEKDAPIQRPCDKYVAARTLQHLQLIITTGKKEKRKLACMQVYPSSSTA